MTESILDPFVRQHGEPATAFAAFLNYCEAGAERSLNRTVYDLGRLGKPVSRRAVEGYSSRWSWVSRAASFDTHRAKVEQAAKDKAIAENAEKWERRKLEAADANWANAERANVKLVEMLNAPLYEETTEEDDEDGVSVKRVTRKPAKWTLQTAAVLMKVIAEVRAAALADGLGNEAFDPATATVEECRDFLEKAGVKLA